MGQANRRRAAEEIAKEANARYWRAVRRIPMGVLVGLTSPLWLMVFFFMMYLEDGIAPWKKVI